MIRNRVLVTIIGVLCIFNVSAESPIKGSESIELGGKCDKLCTSTGTDSYNNKISIKISSEYTDAKETYEGSNKFVCIPCDCGDGVKQEHEACDDGNHKGLDGCTADCGTVEYCGDEIANTPSETCDKGEHNGTVGSVCSKDCKIDICLGFPEEIELLCGNGKKECTEECDAGGDNGNPGSSCTKKCVVDKCLYPTDKLKSLCGNGTKECAEECDAGSANGTPGSSCSKECVVDKCLDAPETVKLLCGNGVKDCNEQCDDKNNVNGDNCDENCKLEDICEGVVPPAITVGGYGWVDNICLKGRFDNTGIQYTYGIIYNDLNSAYAAEGYEVGKDYAKEFNDIAVSKTRGRRNLYLINDVKYLNSIIDPSKICYTCAYIRNGGCFAPETLIQLADGTEVTVADLHAGDEILNPTTKKVVKVKSFIESYEDKPLVEITYLGKTLRVTDGHPMVTSKGIVKAITLKVGDILFDKSGKEVVIEKVKLGELDPSQRVINLIIESEDPTIENHILVSEGVQTGDYIAQKMIAKD